MHGQARLNNFLRPNKIIHNHAPAVFLKISVIKIYILFISLAGSIIIDFRRLNTPSTAMPNSLKGSMINHTIGYNTNVKIASGQQNINRKIQAMNVIIC